MIDLILIYITNPTKAEARKIAKHLLGKKLIACATIFPINSLYWWKGKIAQEKEFVLIAKTRKGNFDRVKKEVEKIHSYEIPCILALPVSSSEKYAKWLNQAIKYQRVGKTII